MSESDKAVVGIIRDDGMYNTLSEGIETSLQSVAEIVIPISLPWKDSVQLRPLPLGDFGQSSSEQPMGPEIQYYGTFEGRNPSSKEPWTVTVRLYEYPQNRLGVTDADSEGDASFAHFDPADLESYMYAVL